MSELRCHVCGRDVGKEFVLFVIAASLPADRSFIVHEECAGRIEKGLAIAKLRVRVLAAAREPRQGESQ